MAEPIATKLINVKNPIFDKTYSRWGFANQTSRNLLAWQEEVASRMADECSTSEHVTTDPYKAEREGIKHVTLEEAKKKVKSAIKCASETLYGGGAKSGKQTKSPGAGIQV